MKSKRILCTLALTTVIFQGIISGTAKAAVISDNRIAGNDRYETSAAISQKGWTTSDTVILASGEKFADALCSGPLAKKYNAPVLLTSSTGISDTTLNELSRLKAKNIIIIGGTGAISAEVENQLKSKGYTTDRIGGQNRYETSAMIAARLDKPTSVVIASGEGFPDALSISTIAAKLGMPILLSSKAGLSDYAKDFITKNGITKTYIVGGTGVLPDTIEKDVPSPTRLSGQNRYGTNLAVIKEFESNLSYDNVYLSSDQSYADALSGAVLASNSSSPIILTNGSIDTNLNDYIKAKLTSNTKVIALGGTGVVSDSLVQTVTDEKTTTGGSSGGGITNNTTPSIQDLSDGGRHTGDYIISTAGNFGDSTKTTSISGSISVKDSGATASDQLVLQNLNIIGTLTVDFGAGNVVLNNVTVNGINVKNVGSHSLHVKGNSVIDNLTVDDPNNDAHIVVEDNATIAAATVLSGANLEVADTATNAQPFSNITLAPSAAPTTSNQVMLTGTFDTVNVAAPAKVVLAPKAQIVTKLIATAPLDFTAPDTATVAKVDIKPAHSTDTFVLSGNLDNVNVSAASNVQVKSGTVKVSSDTKAAVNVTVDQDATVNALADSGIVLKGEGKKFTREKSTEAKVAYLKLGNGKVNEFTINDLPASVTAKKFLNSLFVSAFANVQIVDASGNPVNDDTVLDNTMTLKVTAEDGVTTNTYVLKFAALPTFEANYPTAAAGEDSSKTILLSIKANQPGRVYMIALPSGASAPTSVQVKAGINAAGKFVANANYDLKLGEEKVEKIAVDADNTSYDIYLVLLSANGNLQLKPVKLTATSPKSSSKTEDIVTLSNLKDEVENIKKMTDIPVGSNVGECSQEAKDALNKALSDAQALVETGSTNQEYISRAFNALHEAEKQFKNSIVQGLVTGEYKSITASNDFDQKIQINILGNGKFIDNLSVSNIKLGGDFEGLTVKSVTMDKEHPWEASIELAGSLKYVSGYGTITVNAAGWTGSSTTQDITTKIAVTDPNALNVIWPINNDSKNDNDIFFDHGSVSIGFDSDVQVPTDWSKIIIKDSTGAQVPITSVHNTDSKNALEIELDSIKDGQYTVFIPENTLTDISGSKHNKAISFAFKIELPNTNMDMLKKEMENVKNMLNMPVGDKAGECSQAAKDALVKVLSGAQALIEEGSATQEDINNAFNELQQAEKLLKSSVITGLMSFENKPVTASSDFSQIIKVNIIGAGGFVENLSTSNIKLGGDFEGLTVKSVTMDKEHPWEASIELSGSLKYVSGYGTITVNAAGWTGSSTTQDITTKIAVTDPNALNVIWPINNDSKNDNGIFFDHESVSIGFDSDVQVPTDWSQIIIKDSTGAQVKIVSVHNEFYKNELGIEFDSIKDGQYTISIPENTLTDISGSKHNKAINFTFNIKSPNIDIEMLKNEIENLKNMTNIPVGDKVGDCSQAAKDALIKALTDAQALVEKGNLTQEDINNTFNALQQAQKLMSSSILTGLMSSDYKPVTASSDFSQIIKVNIIGAGGFVENLSTSNIKLGGDFEGLTVKSVIMDKEHPWEAGIELVGNLNYASGYGTITVDAAGWNSMGTTHDITAKVAVTDPSALNVTWPINDIFNNDGFIFNHGGISMGFDNDVQLPTDWSKIIVKDSNGTQVPITGVHYINLDSKKELQIECASMVNGEYSISIPENTLTDVSGSKTNKAINFTFNIQLENANIDMLNKEIENAQNITNVPVGDSVGFCSQQSVMDALKSALSAAQTVVQNSSATQDDMNSAFYGLQQAEQAVGASLVTGIVAPRNNVVANANFNQTIEVSLVGGQFIPKLDQSYITLGGDLAGLTVQSVEIDENSPWRANITLTGNLQINTGSGTITVKGTGWNGSNGGKDLTTTIKVNSGEIIPTTTNGTDVQSQEKQL